MAALKGRFPKTWTRCISAFSALLISAVLICFGMTFLILACAIPQPQLFHPLYVLIFYVLSVVPLVISRRVTPSNETNARSEFALFLASGCVFSAFALPIVLARSDVITWLACWLTLGGNVVNYLTMLGYGMKDGEFEASYGGMF